MAEQRGKRRKTGPSEREASTGADTTPSVPPEAKPGPIAGSPDPAASPPDVDLKKASGRSARDEGTEEQEDIGSPFPVVGIGASAGGLEASTDLLKALPADTGMAFIFVHHLSPEHDSLLVDILTRSTTMPVRFAEDGMRVEPDSVYVIPPDAFLAVFHGTLKLAKQQEVRGERTAIDYFFRSLAKDQRNLAISVVLSGTGSDGSLGIRAVKAEDGIAIAQEPDSAAYDGMPRSAIATGLVDLVLPPAQIAEELIRISKHPFLRPEKTPEPELSHEVEQGRELDRIFVMLRDAAGVDFTYYKPTTVRRRIGRRMVVHHLEDIGDYVKYLNHHPDEIKSLYQDLLINVTGFFREPDAFEALKREVFPRLLDGRGEFDAIRMWVPGCSTGEEPYSLAIALTEFLEDKPVKPPIQIFATDISETSIEKARQGTYPENIASEMSAGRLSRFFSQADGGYQVSKAIRDTCVFAKHDVTRDPPFSRIDLISCRNLLIYLGRVLQRRLIPIFHYALTSDGFLFLGSSESVGEYTDLFEIVDSKFRIYAKKPAALRPPIEFGFRPYQSGPRHAEAVPRTRGMQVDAQKEADRIALERFTPPGVLIDENMQILQFRGDTDPFLRHPPGHATLGLFEMARTGLDTALRAHLPRASEKHSAERISGVNVQQDSQTRVVTDVEIVPLPKTGEQRYFLVFFKEVLPPTAAAPGGSTKATGASDVERLTRELSQTRDQLRITIEEKDSSVEELRAANEEIQSSNEELQSINEELETAKEELQSTNEELTTLNEELQNRNFELLSMNDDFRNVLASVNIPIIILGRDLRIRRYTPMAERVLSLIPTDVGRPITDLKLKIEVPDLPRMIREVVDHLGVSEREVRSESGHWYRLQIRPYRTSEDKIVGVVLTMLDIEDQRARQAHAKGPVEELADARAYLGSMLETMFEPFVVLDEQLRIVGASAAFANMLDADSGDLAGKRLDEIGARAKDVKRLRSLASEAEQKGNASGDLDMAVAAGTRRLRISAGRIERIDAPPLVLLGMTEVKPSSGAAGDRE